MVMAVVLGVIAGLLIAALGAYIVSRRSRPASTPPAPSDDGRPRTVADLVRLRAAEAAAKTAAAPPPELPRRTPGATRASASPATATTTGAPKPRETRTRPAKPAAAPTRVSRVRRMIPLPPPSPSDTDPPWVRATRIVPGVPWDRLPSRGEPGEADPGDVLPTHTSRVSSQRSGQVGLLTRVHPPRRAVTEPTAEQIAADEAIRRTFGLPRVSSTVSLLTPENPDAEPAAASKGDARTVRVRVRSDAGDPVADATLALFDDSGGQVASAQSDPSGSGEIEAPHPGGFLLVTRARGYQPRATALTVADSDLLAEVYLAPSASLRGVVRRAGGEAVHVAVRQDGEVVAEADAGPDGAYRFDDLAPGEYEVTVTVDDTEPISATIRLHGGEEAVCDLDAEHPDPPTSR